MAAGDREERREEESGQGNGTSLALEDRYDNLPPMQQRLRFRDENQNRPAAAAAPNRAYALPPVGSFVPLTEQSWGAQADLVSNLHNGLSFDPGRLFDGIVAEKSGVRGLYDSSRRDYAKYAGLRTNLAVLRNTLLCNGVKAPQLKTIAEALGNAFANDRWWKRPITRWLSVDVANVEGVGAGEMYKYLLEVQHKPAVLQGLRVTINSLLGVPDHNWGLPPLEATPFSPDNLAAPRAIYQAANISAPAQQSFVDHYLASRNAETQISKA